MSKARMKTRLSETSDRKKAFDTKDLRSTRVICGDRTVEYRSLSVVVYVPTETPTTLE